ncbi:MAG: type II secretion system protein M [Gammaproteobacteria bacterium]|nr:type II secretion system protein M [Pseudomonadota bacterium]TDJ10512.1 MAG: type II secretion system protein M [Gammaproteobacteria bacterium]
MREWFESLEARERVFVLAATVVLVFAVLYLGIWMPLDRGQKSLSLSVDNWKIALTELRPLQAQLQNSGSGQMQLADRNQSLVVIIDNSLRERGLYNSLQRSQPTTSNGIRVEFENVAFDDLVLWLGDLNTRYDLQLQSGSFSNPGDSEGRVNSTLTLERS